MIFSLIIFIFADIRFLRHSITPLIFASFSLFSLAPPALPESLRHVDYATLMFR
jgi:hypothetical protein